MTVDVMAHSLLYWVRDVFEAGLFGRGSRLYAMTSEGAILAVPTYGAVSTAKAALEAHIRQLALELMPHGITVNGIRAGVTDTPALRRIPASSPSSRPPRSATRVGGSRGRRTWRMRWWCWRRPDPLDDGQHHRCRRRRDDGLPGGRRLAAGRARIRWRGPASAAAVCQPDRVLRSRCNDRVRSGHLSRRPPPVVVPVRPAVPTSGAVFASDVVAESDLGI